jgi:serine protease Do
VSDHQPPEPRRATALASSPSPWAPRTAPDGSWSDTGERGATGGAPAAAAPSSPPVDRRPGEATPFGAPAPWAPRPWDGGEPAGPPTRQDVTGPASPPPSWDAPTESAAAPSPPPWPPRPTPYGGPPAPPTGPYGSGPYSTGGYQPAAYQAGPYPAAPYQAATYPPGRSSGSGDRGWLSGAVTGAIVGALVAAIVAALVVRATTDDPAQPVSRPQTSITSSANLDVQEILGTVQDSVVSIETGERTGIYGSAGTGFIISPDGYVVTNNHVIEGADTMTVRFFDGTTAPAELIGSFPDNDLAMVKVDRTRLTPAALGSSTALQVGEPVVAIGNALNLGGRPSVTTGIVSGKERSIDVPGVKLDHLIQTDAAINPGNSGGPLLNSNGEVVGINTARVPDAQNIGFAVSIDAVKSLLDDLRQGKGEVNPDNAFLGVRTISVDDPSLDPDALKKMGVVVAKGAVVVAVEAGTGAEKVKMEIGDVIVKVDGRDVASSTEVGDIIRDHKPGDDVRVDFERRGQPMTVTITLVRRGH